MCRRSTVVGLGRGEVFVLGQRYLPLLLVNEPAWVTLDQGSSVAGRVSLPCRWIALDDRAGGTRFDDCAATGPVARACDCPAIHERCACAGFYCSFAMDRAVMTVAYQDEALRKCP